MSGDQLAVLLAAAALAGLGLGIVVSILVLWAWPRRPRFTTRARRPRADLDATEAMDYNGHNGYNLHVTSNDRDKLNISIYAADHAWLQSRQRRLSADRDEWTTMADIVRGLRVAVEQAEQGI